VGLLKSLRKLGQPSPQEKQERKNRKEAYRVAYNKGAIQKAKREGYKKGMSQGSGSRLSLESIGKGLGDFTRASERTMGLMLGDIGVPSSHSQPQKQKRSGTRPIRIIVSQSGTRKHKRKTSEPRQWWEL
jgi:hypothetical protein